MLNLQKSQWYLICFMIIPFNSFAFDYQRLNWGNVEVFYINDQSFPIYNLAIYFGDGALSDQEGKIGESSLAFNAMTEGTDRYQQKDIADILDFYAVSPSVDVTHEYTTVSIGGLEKDIIPTMKFMCHLFRRSNYPTQNINNLKKLYTENLKNMVIDPKSLASRIFREVSLKGTSISEPQGGKIQTLKKINSHDLINKLNYFNNDVKKRIYLSGPASSLKIKDVILKDCQWGESGTFERKKQTKISINTKYKGKTIFFVPMDEGNQAQVRIGKSLKKDVFNLGSDKVTFANSILGRSFTSILMQEVRVKKGLTYSIYSFAGEQANYGRSFISTATKNETVVELLELLKGILSDVNTKNLPDQKLVDFKKFLSGRHLFQFESSSKLLGTSMHYDHINREVSEILKFNSNIKDTDAETVKNTYQRLFKWDEQIILVLGNKELYKLLDKANIFPIVKLNYKDYL